MSGLVVASSNGCVGIRAAVEALRQGGSASDAVIAGIAPVEANPDDHSVGSSGPPNLLGEVELDASIMEGGGLRAGLVGALHGYQDAIALARAVMDELPHVLIGGQGAARFAAEMGFQASDLLTPDAERLWRKRLEDSASPSSERYAYHRKVRELVRSMTDVAELVEPPHGTVSFIARDRDGNLACGVSTSGWAWKCPGRMGDSPVIGAGNYADNRWGPRHTRAAAK